jgi:hypothetical protein
MTRTARRIAALLSAVTVLLGGAAAVTATEAGVANAGTCCTTR